MNLFIVLFFVSLLGIIIMLGRKLRVLGNGQAFPTEQAALPSLRFEETRGFILKIVKRLGYFLLVESIRVYVKLADAVKKTWMKLRARFEKIATPGSESAIKPPSKFLKTIADYKRKVRKIKEQVKEEEL